MVAGFAGTNTVEKFKYIRDWKKRTRPNLKIDEIYEYTRASTVGYLVNYCANANFVINLASVNRPKEAAKFMIGNFSFASTLLDWLKKHNNKAPVTLSNHGRPPLQAGLTNQNTESKIAGEDVLQYAVETGLQVYVYRYPNLMGKWVRPNCNSAVGTFCHNIANDLSIMENDSNVELEVLLIDDLIEELLDCVEDIHIAASKVIGGGEYDGLTPKPVPDGGYCYAPVPYKVTHVDRLFNCLTRYTIGHRVS